MMQPLGCLLLLLLIGGCDQFYSVSGVVTDCATGTPIGAANVRLVLEDDGEIDTDEGQTDAAGEFQLVLNAPHGEELASLDVSKDGYAAARQSVRSEDRTTVCLDEL